MPETPDVDIAVVGAGPVGTFLANLAGLRGLSVALIDRETGIHPLPRAVHFDGEVMRAFQAIDLSEPIGAIARPSAKGMHFQTATGKTLLIRRGQEGTGPQDWANNYYMHQPHLEQVLRQGLQRFANVQLLFGHSVIAIGQDRDGATVSMAARPGEAPKSLRARYVVGCDGARSFVRGVIGSPMEDLGLSQEWLVVDAIVRPESPRVRALSDYTIQLCDPERPMTLVYVGGNRRRWEIMLMPGDDPGAITDHQAIWSLISRWLTPADATLERAAVYTFRSVIARGWRSGRLLLAGDACHQTPPFLGQGLCAGIRDAMNLVWKLDVVVAGRADATLLDTYESERRPHVHAFIKLAVELGAIIQAIDPETVRARDAQFAGAEPEMFDFPLPQLGPGLRCDGAVPVGQVFPQPRLDDGRRLDDVAGGRFAIVTDQAFRAALPAGIVERCSALGVGFVDAPSRPIAAWLAANDARAVLIRPDAYVVALAATPSDLVDPLAMIERWYGSNKQQAA